jgi:hypothetical protein
MLVQIDCNLLSVIVKEFHLSRLTKLVELVLFIIFNYGESDRSLARGIRLIPG